MDQQQCSCRMLPVVSVVAPADGMAWRYDAGIVSALLDNVTTVLLMGPITISMMETCNMDPRPLLMAQVQVADAGTMLATFSGRADLH